MTDSDFASLDGEIYLKLGKYYNERKQVDNERISDDMTPSMDFPKGQEQFFIHLMKTISTNNRLQSDAILAAVAKVMAEYIGSVQNK